VVDFSSAPSRFSVLDPANLGRLEALESINSDDIIAARMARFKALWATFDPPNAATYDVGQLEFDPIKIQAENNAYFETLLRDRVNQAVRAVTLAFAFGSNLEGLASNYPGGVPRIAGESDDRYRRRIWSSPNPLSPHGTAEGYEFWGLTALATLRDVRTVKIRPSLSDNPIVVIACLADAVDPSPSQSDLLAVRAFIMEESRLAMTDEISVSPPKIIDTNYVVRVDLFPGPDKDTMMAQLRANIDALIEKQRWLGYDHTRAAIDAALMVSGVHNVSVIEPAEDIMVRNDWFVRVNSVDLQYGGRAE